MIDVKNLTLTYPSGKGVFDLDFSVVKGEVMGYLGPNGAGKTTTIRALMGFMKPDSGSCSISGNDCFREAPNIQKRLGYIPGEITFLDGMAGDEYLRFIRSMRGQKNGNTSAMEKMLLDRFELDPRGKIKKFSKGMKQKLGIVSAFMHDPDVLILDEPTSGLDPLMQSRFVELILEEKRRGKTILMSSHSFEEVERTCDTILIIKEGRIIHKSDAKSLKSSQRRIYLLRAADPDAATDTLSAAGFDVARTPAGLLETIVAGDQIDLLIKTCAGLKIEDLDVKTQTLEDVFMHFYGKGGV